MNPNRIQSILLDTDGTVTDIVHHYTGEAIKVKKVSQNIINSVLPTELQLQNPSSLLHRKILLTGKKPYLFAESYFVIDRLSQSMQEQLLNSDIPIGLLWQREKLETFREILTKTIEKNDELALLFPELKDNQFWSRTYLVYHSRQPIGLITEKFPTVYFQE